MLQIVRNSGIASLSSTTWELLRRSLATLLFDAGALVKLTQEIMRHSNARVTLELYQQVSMGAKQELQARVVKSWNVGV